MCKVRDVFGGKRMKLITTPRVKKNVDKAVIFCVDEQSYAFDLEEWDMYRDIDWIELRHKNKKHMECFYVHNILRVSFDAEERKLKPVPPITNNPGA